MVTVLSKLVSFLVVCEIICDVIIHKRLNFSNLIIHSNVKANVILLEKKSIKKIKAIAADEPVN